MKYEDKYYILKWYSHTATDCDTEPTPEDKERCLDELPEKDRESASIIDIIEAQSDDEAIRKFEDYVIQTYFPEELEEDP